MKKLSLTMIATAGLMAAPNFANAAGVNPSDEIEISLDEKKFDKSIAAEQRFEKLERFADRKCDTTARDIEALRFERTCALELKRSILSQVDDAALTAVAEQRGVLS
jgi:hypothetical protein